jgi:hypothetical protein
MGAGMTDTSIRDILERLERDWATPRPVLHPGSKTPALLQCSVERVAGVEPAPGAAPLVGDLAELRRHARSARLFVDSRYGQWGLVLLSPERSREATEAFRTRRARDHREGDLVVGEFLGDSDLLLVRADPHEPDAGKVIVALPLDPRAEWYAPAASLREFLERFERAEGAKYWEPSRTSRD